VQISGGLVETLRQGERRSMWMDVVVHGSRPPVSLARSRPEAKVSRWPLEKMARRIIVQKAGARAR
jgi:hypothetical protein